MTQALPAMLRLNNGNAILRLNNGNAMLPLKLARTVKSTAMAGRYRRGPVSFIAGAHAASAGFKAGQNRIALSGCVRCPDAPRPIERKRAHP